MIGRLFDCLFIFLDRLVHFASLLEGQSGLKMATDIWPGPIRLRVGPSCNQKNEHSSDKVRSHSSFLSGFKPPQFVRWQSFECLSFTQSASLTPPASSAPP